MSKCDYFIPYGNHCSANDGHNHVPSINNKQFCDPECQIPCSPNIGCSKQHSPDTPKPVSCRY